MDAILIRPMAEYAQQVPLVAGWFHKEWRTLYGEQTQSDVQREIENWLTQGTIPTAFVAVSGDQVVGTIALKEHEEQFIETPWLAGLFVVPEFRNRGIGRVLVQTGEYEAFSLGVRQLFLYTPKAQQFYISLGWTILDRRLLPGGLVTLMSKLLTAGNVSAGQDLRRS